MQSTDSLADSKFVAFECLAGLQQMSHCQSAWTVLVCGLRFEIVQGSYGESSGEGRTYWGGLEVRTNIQFLSMGTVR